MIAEGKISEEQSSNKFGASGTFAHDLAETALLHLLGKKVSKDIEESQSLHHWLEKQQCFFEGELVQNGYGELESYIDYCMSCVKHEKDIVYVEVRSRLFYSENPDDKGTCDFLILHHDGSITIVDLKWRRSGMVESFENLQLSAYAMSYIKNKMIVSPKANVEVSLATYNPLVAPYVKPWKTSMGELRNFCNDKIQKQMDLIKSGFTMFIPSKKACEWCPAKMLCGARTASVVTAFPDTFDVATIADKDLVQYLKTKEQALKFYDDIETRLYNLADQGKAVEGTQLVEGRSNRRYDDEEKAAIFLSEYLSTEDIFHSPKIKAFTEIVPKLSKELKQVFEKDYLVKPKGKLKIVLTDKTEVPTASSLKSKLLKSVAKQ